MTDSRLDPIDLQFHSQPQGFGLEVRRIKWLNRQHLDSLPRDEAQGLVDVVLQPQI